MPADSSRININADATKQHTYDAIVIGSGISGGQPNPSLLYMALTARAVNYAADEMKKGNL